MDKVGFRWEPKRKSLFSVTTDIAVVNCTYCHPCNVCSDPFRWGDLAQWKWMWSSWNTVLLRPGTPLTSGAFLFILLSLYFAARRTSIYNYKVPALFWTTYSWYQIICLITRQRINFYQYFVHDPSGYFNKKDSKGCVSINPIYALYTSLWFVRLTCESSVL